MLTVGIDTNSDTNADHYAGHRADESLSVEPVPEVGIADRGIG